MDDCAATKDALQDADETKDTARLAQTLQLLSQQSSLISVLPGILPAAEGDHKIKNYQNLLRLKPDAEKKPFWVLPDTRIILEAHSPVYAEAEALLIAIAEPVSRTRFLQEYQLTPYSLYAGASMGLKTGDILDAMDRFSKTLLPPEVRTMIHDETSRYGKVKLVMKAHQLFVECRGKPELLSELLRDKELEKWRPVSRLESVKLHILGRSRRVLTGNARFLPSEVVCAFDNYRRVEMLYGSMLGLRIVPRDPRREQVGAARADLRFRMAFASDGDLKEFHDTLALDYNEGTNPLFDPRNPQHELILVFASEQDRRRFWKDALPRMRKLAQLSTDERAALSIPFETPHVGGGGGEFVENGLLQPDAAAIDVEADVGLDAFRRAEELEELGDATLDSFEVDPSRMKQVKERCRELRWPLLEEYDFRNDTANPELPIELKPESKIRDYQEQALKRCFGNHRARSGIIVLPCGAGKTLVGIVAACTVKRSTLVLCNSSVSVEQWYQQFLMWAQIDRDRVSRFTSARKEPLHQGACILISTYNMIGYTAHRSDETHKVMGDVSNREWGLVILDEVHVAAADSFLACLTTCTRSRCKLGLTATLVREDGKIEQDVLNAQIGPKLFEANWLDLQERGFIAKVQCAEVWCEMTPEFFREYLAASTNIQRLLYAMNPNKFRSCQFLMRHHEERGDKIIIFSDNVYALREYARVLNRPYIDGAVKQNERMRILQQFKTGGAFATVLISKVGDTSIDLPEANVIIQIASQFGSRRQEAQRLGRILRPKARTGDAFNAFFYTLVSRDTREMYYSVKRQQFLVDQGYAFKVIPELVGMADEDLSFSTQKEQLDLLGSVLAAKEADIQSTEQAEENEQAKASAGGEDSHPTEGISRKRANMNDLSGAGSMVYTEGQPAHTASQSKISQDFQKQQKLAAKAARERLGQ